MEEMWVVLSYIREDGATILVETCRRKRRLKKRVKKVDMSELDKWNVRLYRGD